MRGGRVARHGLESAARCFGRLVVHHQHRVRADAVPAARSRWLGAVRRGFRCWENTAPAVPGRRWAARRASSRHKVVDDFADQLCGLGIAEFEDLDVAGQLFEHAVAYALAQSVPGHHVAQRLALEVGRAGGIDDDDQVGFARQVVDGTAHLLDAVVLEHRFARGLVRLPFAQQLLAVGVVGLVGEHRQMRQRGDGLQAQVGQFGRLLVLDAAEQPVLGAALRVVGFWMRIFSVLVTMTLKLLPQVMGICLSPSRVKVSFRLAAKGLWKRGGRRRS
jgi:hypothetical protein